ncbi:MAG: DUF4838 domain-containing protein, partial [Lentisphaeria bacterium]|nr:DUF4838 domain-containing protein [Lentisphaeria bacterium]
VSGDMIQNVLWRITEGKQLASKPGVLVLLIGTNNLHQQPVNTPGEIVDGIDNLLCLIKKELPDTKILLLGVLPRKGNYPLETINKGLAETARKHRISFMDIGSILLRGGKEVEPEIFRDGLHLSPAGYELFAQTILPEIMRLTAVWENALMALPEKKSSYQLYLAKDAITPERKAAEELQYFFGRIFGETPEIVTEFPADDKVILIGHSSEASKLLPDVDFSKLKTDEIILRKTGNRLVLTGARPRGSLYAVYTLLEDFLGVKFYTSFEQETPKLSRFTVPDVNIRYAPVIKVRGSFFHDLLYTDQLFAIRLRNNEDFLKNKQDYGCEINFIGGVHSFDRLIPARKYLKTHPEFFSLRGKERVGGQFNGQLCLSNDDMRGELTRNLLKLLRKNPKATMVSVSQNDNTLPCECNACRAETEKEGSPAGPMIRFVNQIAEEVEKEFPNVTVQTFAYQYTSTPPKFARPRHNVEVRLCSIGSNFAAPLDSPKNASFSRELREWSKIAPRLSVWNYVTNFSNYLRPFPNLTVLAEDIRSFGKYNVGAVLEQGDWNSGGVTGDFVALKAYVISKLLWNPALEPRKVMDKFIGGYYGAAAPQIREYLELIENEVEKNDTYLGCFTAHIDKILSLESILAGYRLMLKAEDAVKDKEFKFRERVKIAGLPIRFAMLERALPLKRKYGANTPDLNAVFQDTMAIAKRNRTNKYNETHPFSDLEKDLRTRVDQAMNLKPVKIRPAECTENLKSGTYWEIQDIVKQVPDPAASDGSASRETGKIYTWSLQFPPSLDNFPMKSGKYRIVASLRAELKEGVTATGNASEGGSYDLLKKKITMKNIPLKELVGSEYKEFDLGIHELNPNCYLYIAPKKNDAMKYLYVDRLTIIKAE